MSKLFVFDTKKSDKNNKKVKKNYGYWEKQEILGLTTLLKRRKRGDLIETFKRMEFLIMVDIFLIFLFETKI